MMAITNKNFNIDVAKVKENEQLHRLTCYAQAMNQKRMK